MKTRNGTTQILQLEPTGRFGGGRISSVEPVKTELASDGQEFQERAARHVARMPGRKTFTGRASAASGE